MPTKTKHMARKASLSESAPLAKQIKQEKQETTELSEAKVVLDTAKVEAAVKALPKIPKKKVQASEDQKSVEIGNEKSDKVSFYS